MNRRHRKLENRRVMIMNSKETSHTMPDPEGTVSDRDDILESLFSHAHARERAPKEDEHAIRASLHCEWTSMTRQRQRRKTVIAWGIAASVLLAAVISVNMLNREATPPVMHQVATVEKQSGNIFLRQGDEPSSESRRLASGKLFAGQVLSTAQDARLAVAMGTMEVIRINENTRLVFVSESEIELISGQIYVDSGPAAATTGPDDALIIRTIAGSVRHLGTQYITGIDGSTLAVSVREGQVLIKSQYTESIANRGQQLSINQAGTASIASIPTHGPLWEWAELVTPKYDLDGRSAHDFINWVGRETGRMVRFAADGAEQLARATELRGSIELEPMRALDLILQTSDLVPMLENGSIVIRKRTES